MIYLDHNATTPVRSDVFEAMRPFFLSEWGNPSSSYRFGAKLKGVIEGARAQVANLLGAYTSEVVFTSCATESNNTAIHCALKSSPHKKHVITSAVEHSSVMNHCMALARDGYRITFLPVNSEGLLALSDLETALTDDTAIVSLMWANNETGVLFPVEKIGQICRSRRVLFHCDAVQAVGKIPIDLKSVSVDYLSVTGHKLGSPKGIGVLYINRKAPVSPYLYGGHQERGRRGGTECVPLIVGLGKAAEIAERQVATYSHTVRVLRDELESGILNSISNTELNGHQSQRLSNTTNIVFHGIESEALLLLLDQAEVCASRGSACLADAPEPSHVIAAMRRGLAPRQSIRFSLGISNTATEIREALDKIRRAICVLSPSSSA